MCLYVGCHTATVFCQLELQVYGPRGGAEFVMPTLALDDMQMTCAVRQASAFCMSEE